MLQVLGVKVSETGHFFADSPGTFGREAPLGITRDSVALGPNSTVPTEDGSIHVAGDVGARDPTLDVARGLIIVLMALDHVRIYFSSAQFEPTDLDRTTLAYFLMRWVTHLCAPGFFFLAGLSAGLFGQRSGRAEVARLLLIRGTWLVVLEILVFGFAWSFNPGWWWFGVIAGLGASMIAMSGLVYVPRLWLFGAALAFTVFHNAIWASGLVPDGTVATLLYSGGMAQIPFVGQRIVLYPLLPWLALMALGYGATPWLANREPSANRHLLIVSAGALAAFLLVRAAGFGQPMNGGFDTGRAAEWNAMSFLNVEKYPPSLQFSLVTLGLCLLFLAVVRNFDLSRPTAVRPLLVFGQVPFFFYLLHLFVIHTAALAVARLLNWPSDYLFWGGVGPNLVPPEGYGFEPAGIYLTWLAVLAALFPLCTLYARYKRDRDSWWLKLL